MKVSINDIDGSITKNDERYVVKDNNTLENLVLSSTTLNAGKSTTGHFHKGQEEIYYFVKGSGSMELDENTFPVEEGDVVLIRDGAFHRVHAGLYGCYFVCVFDGCRKIRGE